jgi:hypothetical protein
LTQIQRDPVGVPLGYHWARRFDKVQLHTSKLTLKN